MKLFDGYGNVLGLGKDYDRTVKGVNHRGFSTIAPENTLPAYKLSKENGFYYVECDVRFTSDGVAVLMHDSSINRTARTVDGAALEETVYIQDITLEEAKTYDCGCWKSSAYAGAKIPTAEEFILFCKYAGLHPYLEIKAGTQPQVESLVDTVKKCGMAGKVTYIGGIQYLNYVKAYDPSARLGPVIATLTESLIADTLSLKTGSNEVFVDASNANLTEDLIAMCSQAQLSLEVWTVNSADTIRDMNPYISGVTSDELHAGKLLYEMVSEVNKA